MMLLLPNYLYITEFQNTTICYFKFSKSLFLDRHFYVASLFNLLYFFFFLLFLSSSSFIIHLVVTWRVFFIVFYLASASWFRPLSAQYVVFDEVLVFLILLPLQCLLFEWWWFREKEIFIIFLRRSTLPTFRNPFLPGKKAKHFNFLAFV